MSKQKLIFLFFVSSPIIITCLILLIHSNFLKSFITVIEEYQQFLYYNYGNRDILLTTIESKLLINHSDKINNTSFLNVWYGNGIIFIKTHKTAGSTLNCILWKQLCEYQNKNCFLPPKESPGRTWDMNKEYDKGYIFNSNGTRRMPYPFEVWLHHVKYSVLLEEVVYQPSLVISIIRRPAFRFRSAWSWYEHDKLFGITLQEFSTSQQSKFYFQKNPKYFKYRTGLDITSEEIIGFSKFKHTQFNNEFYHLIEKMFNNKVFLLVSERFDESLIILKKIMNWSDYNSILYFNKKVTINPENITDQALSNLDLIQPYDSVLYYYANYLLDKYIISYGKLQFDNDLRYFKKELVIIKKLCFGINNYNNTSKTSNNNNRNENINLCYSLLRDNSDIIKDTWKRIESFL